MPNINDNDRDRYKTLWDEHRSDLQCASCHAVGTINKDGAVTKKNKEGSIFKFNRLKCKKCSGTFMEDVCWDLLVKIASKKSQGSMDWAEYAKSTHLEEDPIEDEMPMEITYERENDQEVVVLAEDSDDDVANNSDNLPTGGKGRVLLDDSDCSDANINCATLVIPRKRVKGGSSPKPMPKHSSSGANPFTANDEVVKELVNVVMPDAKAYQQQIVVLQQQVQQLTGKFEDAMKQIKELTEELRNQKKMPPTKKKISNDHSYRNHGPDKSEVLQTVGKNVSQNMCVVPDEPNGLVTEENPNPNVPGVPNFSKQPPKVKWSDVVSMYRPERQESVKAFFQANEEAKKQQYYRKLDKQEKRYKWQTEKKTDLRLVYVNGIARMPKSKLKKCLFDMHFRVSQIVNIDYVGQETEFLVTASYVNEFKKNITKLGTISLLDDFNASIHRGAEPSPEQQKEALDRFVYRVSKQLSTPMERVNDFYNSWLQELGETYVRKAAQYNKERPAVVNSE